MRIILLAGAFLCAITSFSQPVSKENLAELKRSENAMKAYARKMVQDMNAADRFSADSIFIRSFVQALKTPHSFYYPFDSLETISRIYAPDSTFRVFSWQFTRDDNYYRQRGAIQMRTADGSLKLYPLVDMSEFTTSPQDSIRTPQNWIGAIYYGIIMKTYNGRNYYTLLGFDDNNMRSTKKWIEVLTFDDAGRPVFGGPYFSVKQDEIKSVTPGMARFGIEYKKVGRARMNYDREMDMIVFDHLISEDNDPTKKFTLVPDGDYEGFKWDNGRWVHVSKVFDFKLEDGQAPLPDPLKDDTGKSNEEKLFQQSQKNGLKISRDPQQAPVPSGKKISKKSSLDRQPKQLEEY